MAASFPLDRSILDKWRDHLRDIDFWLKGYLQSNAYHSLRKKLVAYEHMQWNVGVGPTACFTKAISSIIREEKMRLDGPFDHVIEVDMKQASRPRAKLNINDRLAIKVAEQLGLLAPNQEYRRLKEEDDELRYYTYGLMDNGTDSVHNLSRSMVPHILQKLLGTRYMLVVENIDEPINSDDTLTQAVGLPPPRWEGSFWLMSTTSGDVYEDSKLDNECVVESFSGDDILILTIYSLHQAAKYISNVVGDKDEQHWHLVALWCFHYAVMLLNPFAYGDSAPLPFNYYFGETGNQSSSKSKGLPRNNLADIQVDPFWPLDIDQLFVPEPPHRSRRSENSPTPKRLPWNKLADIPTAIHQVVPILRVANEVEVMNPRVAYLCRFYALEKIHGLDPTSSGPGVHSFKTAILQKLERDIEPTLRGRVKPSDSQEMKRFWQHYHKKYIQEVLDASDTVGQIQLSKRYETAAVLFDVLSLLNLFKSSGAREDITSDKHDLIRQWASQGIRLVFKGSVQERIGEVTGNYHGKYNDDDNVYQVGNVILEAFQEYSLLQLPFPAFFKADDATKIAAFFKADDATKTAAHFLAYHGLIAEQLTIDELWDDHHHPRLEHMRWISHVDDQGWQISREWLGCGPRGPTTLIIRRCSQSFFAKLDQLLPKLLYLHVLDLSDTVLESLPPSVCYLQKLQLLILKRCELTNPFISFPSNNRINLLYLDLSYSNVESFDSDFFHNMPSLQELLLVGCFDLVQLPPSIATLTRLTTLKITKTRIKSFHYWEIFNNMKNLLSLELINKWEVKTEEELKLEGHPTLRSFSLVAAPYIRRLSFNGCRKLESVDTLKGLVALEELDLSATGIKELPADILNLPRLRKLLLIGVPSLRRFPWHHLKRLPDIFCLDQRLEGNEVHSSPQVTQVVSTSNSRLFYSFNANTGYLVRSGQIFKSFYIQVKSFKARIRKMNDEDDMMTSNMFQLSVSTYADVNHLYLTEGVSMVSMDDMLPFLVTERHVEISAVDQYPAGLTHLLEVTKSVCMMDDTQVTCLSDHLSNFDDLEECKLRRCHRMVHVFEVATYLGNNLKNAWVSYLKSLTHFYRPPGSGATFRALKHVRLEHCPRLEGFMPCDCELPSLVTLDILFCYNLKAIFYSNGYHSSPRRYQLPSLQKICLQELPLLEHLYVDDDILSAPKWEEFQVRGCWSLRRLPHLHQQPDKTVKVSGEQAWWAKLRWDGQGDGAHHHRSIYKPSLPPDFTFVNERFVIKSYLR